MKPLKIFRSAKCRVQSAKCQASLPARGGSGWGYSLPARGGSGWSCSLPARGGSGWGYSPLSILFISIFLLSLSSCINDDIGICPEGEGGNGGSGNGALSTYWITLNVYAPQETGTRAHTRTLTNEDGTTYEVPASSPEKQLVSAHIYFCDKDYGVLADFESDYVEPLDEDGNSTIRIKINGLDELTALAGKTVKVLIVGNKKINEATELYTPRINKNSAGQYDLSTATFPISSVTANPIGKFGESGHYMPLVSADPYELEIDEPEDGVTTAADIIKALFNRSTPTINWWDVNVNERGEIEYIKMERAVARLEYRGVINTSEVEGEYKETHDYEIDGLKVKARLFAMTPFNINPVSYLFRHTSVGTDNAWGGDDSIRMFGVENGKNSGDSEGNGAFDGYNWIASPYWKTGTMPSLLNPFSVNSDAKAYNIGGNAITLNTPGTVLVSELKTISEDLKPDNSSSAIRGYSGGYHPFCYVSEHTLYSQEQMQPGVVEPLATGVAFKFQILGSDDEPVTKNSDNLSEELAWSQEPGKENYLEITNYATGEWAQIAPTEVDGKTYYFLDYMVNLRHNAINENLLPMYYGVVRNNTYQITINRLGGIPNPLDPKKLYIDVAIKVKSWQKRDVSFDF